MNMHPEALDRIVEAEPFAADGLVHPEEALGIPTEQTGKPAGHDKGPPWSDEPTPVPVVAPEVEAWARALVIADGGKPDPLIGFPALPRWCSYIRYAEQSIRAQAIVAEAST